MSQPFFLSLLLAAALLAPDPAPASRSWTDNTGKYKTEASFVGLVKDRVRLQRLSGTIISVPWSRLSVDDQKWIRENTVAGARLIFAERVEIASLRVQEDLGSRISKTNEELRNAEEQMQDWIARERRLSLSRHLSRTQRNHQRQLMKRSIEKYRGWIGEYQRSISRSEKAIKHLADNPGSLVVLLEVAKDLSLSSVSPRFDPEKLQTNKAGMFRRGLRIHQVIDEQTALVIGLETSSGSGLPTTSEPFLLRNYSTEGLADGVLIPEPLFLAIQTTAEYVTVAGAKRTVYVARPTSGKRLIEDSP